MSTYVTGSITGYIVSLYHSQSVGRPKIKIVIKRYNKSNTAKAASCVLKQLRIPFDVSTKIEIIFAEKNWKIETRYRESTSFIHALLSYYEDKNIKYLPNKPIVATGVRTTPSM